MAKNNQAAATAKLAAAAAGAQADDAVQSTAVASTAAPAEAGQGMALAVDGNAGPAYTQGLIGGEELAAAAPPVQGGTVPESAATVADTQAASLDIAAAWESRPVAARVLVDGRFGRVNAVVQVTAAELVTARGELDPHPAAVAYAKSLANRG